MAIYVDDGGHGNNATFINLWPWCMAIMPPSSPCAYIYMCVVYVCWVWEKKNSNWDYSAIESISEWLLGRGFVEYVRLIPWRTSTGDRRRDERLDDVTNSSDQEVVGASNHDGLGNRNVKEPQPRSQRFRHGISIPCDLFMFSVKRIGMWPIRT